jgi:hypothetical protein
LPTLSLLEQFQGPEQFPKYYPEQFLNNIVDTQCIPYVYGFRTHHPMWKGLSRQLWILRRSEMLQTSHIKACWRSLIFQAL